MVQEIGRDQRLMIFFSADLVGSTAFKLRHEITIKGKDNWSTVLRQFYLDFSTQFSKFSSQGISLTPGTHEEYCPVASKESDAPWKQSRIQFWKVLGDEILFREVLFAEEQVLSRVLAFYDTITDMDSLYGGRELGVKGCVWTAGFPIRNKEINVIPGLRRFSQKSGGQFGTGASEPEELARSPFAAKDYVGIEIDAGFRLAQHTTRRRVVVSLDVADFLTRCMNGVVRHGLKLHHLDWRILKGCYNERPYPIIWVSKGEKERLAPWEGFNNDLSEKFFSKEPTSGDEIIKLIADVRDHNPPPTMITPYIVVQQMPAPHQKGWATSGLVSTVITIITEPEAGEQLNTADIIMPTESLHTIKLQLRDHPKTIEKVISYAKMVLNHSKYKEWLDGPEQGGPFPVPPDLSADNQALKRTFDELGLIVDDILLVKITQISDKICFTDGLWVPKEFRVFPFSDESQRLLEYVRARGLCDWPDILIDPATGCGHHINAMAHVKQKVAADYNSRAVAYCDLNRLLNGTDNAIVCVNDIQCGLPMIEPTIEHKKILLMVNMPFALSPSENTLPLSADGGETGARMTFKALDALKRFAEENGARSAIRAILLHYSVGNEAADQWEVLDKAVSLFGQDNIEHTILRGHGMWRVRGKKEQRNPMDVKYLSLKADDPWYVTPSKSEQVKQGYELLAQKLLHKGWTHVGYGILDIKCGKQ